MNDESKKLLWVIGRLLDRSDFPRVTNGGFVLPSKPHVLFQPMGKEIRNDSEGQRRSATEPRSRAVGRQGPASEFGATGRSWSTGDTSPLLNAIGDFTYQAELDAVCDAYPGTQIWAQGGGFWLFVESSLLPGLHRRAVFLVAVSTENQIVRAWGFWNECAVGTTWIGPRHTNFPDGSICAFEPRDSTWKYGDHLIELLDIYSVWALRHLHYEVFGQWPGPQSVAFSYERILELRDGELCGCGRPHKRYAECCKPRDLKEKPLAAAATFGFFSHWAERCPPRQIVDFMLLRNNPPEISSIFT